MSLIKLDKKLYEIDLENNRIDFLDNRFYKTPEGGFVPSVTTILEAYPKGAQFYEWLKQNGQNADEIRDEAGRKGSVVHNLTERYDLEEEVSIISDNGIQFKMLEWSMFERYVDFRTRFAAELLEIELHLSSTHLGYGGTLDRLVRFEGKVMLLDIKTSNALHNHFWLQLSAYAELLKQELGIEVDEIAILWLNAKTKTDGKAGTVQGRGWQLVRAEKDIDQYLTLFNQTHSLWLEENKNATPRKLSYQITHQLKIKRA